MEHLEEVLGIGIVADPAEVEHLRAAFVHRREERVPRHVPRRKLNTDTIVERRHQLDHLTRILRGAPNRNLQMESPPRLRIGAAGIAGLGQQRFRLLLVVGVGKRRFKPSVHTRWQRSVTWQDAVVQEPFPRRKVERAVERLAQLPVRSQHRILHVDAHVEHRQRRSAVERHALLLELRQKLTVLADHGIPVVA